VLGQAREVVRAIPELLIDRVGLLAALGEDHHQVPSSATVAPIHRISAPVLRAVKARYDPERSPIDGSATLTMLTSSSAMNAATGLTASARHCPGRPT